MVLFERVVHWLSKRFNWIAAVSIGAMMVLTCADVLGRYFFRSPIPGTYEVTGLLGLVVISFAMAHTQSVRGHVSLDFLVLKLRQRLRAITLSIGYLVSLGLSVLITWRSAMYAASLWQVGEASPTEKIPYAPFAYLITIGFAALSLILLIDFLRTLAGEQRK